MNVLVSRKLPFIGTEKLKIFVVSAPRSGSSAMYRALKSVLKLPGYGESHAIPAFRAALEAFDSYLEFKSESKNPLLVKKVDAGKFHDTVCNFIRDFYISEYKSECWVDKTPLVSAIKSIDLVAKAFPDAKIVITKRNGLEMVNSHLSKFGSEIDDACKEWKGAAEAILNARKSGINFLEIDQFDMANQPSTVSKALAAHVGVVGSADHFAAFFSESRLDKTSTHDWSAKILLEDLPWSEKNKSTFKKICGQAMQDLGYRI